MTLARLAGLALLTLGAALLYVGWNATRAPLERFSERLTGRYSDRTVTQLVGGGAAAVVGLGLLVAGAGGARRR